jgi:hypothetical protein
VSARVAYANALAARNSTDLDEVSGDFEGTVALRRRGAAESPDQTSKRPFGGEK